MKLLNVKREGKVLRSFAFRKQNSSMLRSGQKEGAKKQA